MSKNIKRNMRRPKKNQTPFLTASSASGRKSEKEGMEIMKKLDTWKMLGNNLTL